MRASRLVWVLQHVVARKKEISVRLSGPELRAHLSEYCLEYHWPGVPLEDGDTFVGVRFPLLVRNAFFLAPLRRSGSQLPMLRLVASVTPNREGSTIRYRVRLPILLSSFLALIWLIPWCVGIALFVSGFRAS